MPKIFYTNLQEPLEAVRVSNGAKGLIVAVEDDDLTKDSFVEFQPEGEAEKLELRLAAFQQMSRLIDSIDKAFEPLKKDKSAVEDRLISLLTGSPRTAASSAAI